MCIRDSVQSKMIYLWEMRMRRYRNSYRLLEWDKLLEAGAPKAREIQQHIKIDLKRKQS